MRVPVIYTGPRDVLDLHATTEPIRFHRGEVVEVPEPLVSFLKGLSGHGFEVVAEAPAPVAPPVEVAPEPAPVEETESEPIPAPANKRGRKPKGG